MNAAHCEYLQEMFKLLVSLSLLFQCTYQHPIVNGKPVSSAQLYPWMVRLNLGSSTCTGSLVDATTVVSAAHCIGNVNVQGSSAYVGRLGVQDPNAGENIPLAAAIPHPQFKQNRLTQGFDIAVFKLSRPVRSITKFMILDPGSRSYEGQSLISAGWGVLGDNRQSTTTLRETRVKVVNNNSCRRDYGTLGPTWLCAAQGRTGPCYGDSGGPLFTQDGIMVGTVSHGTGTCLAPFAVYSRVSALQGFIKQHMGQKR